MSSTDWIAVATVVATLFLAGLGGYVVLRERLSKVESSDTYAHKRIDESHKRIDELKETVREIAKEIKENLEKLRTKIYG